MYKFSEEVIKKKYHLIKGELTERSRRIWAASEAMAYGRGGITLIHKSTGLAHKTIQQFPPRHNIDKKNLKLF